MGHPHRLQGAFENLSRRCRPKMLPASITTERDKMKIAGLLVADEGLGHLNILPPRLKRETRGTPIQTSPTRPQTCMDKGHYHA
jgi:hypothetical protein